MKAASSRSLKTISLQSAVYGRTQKQTHKQNLISQIEARQTYRENGGFKED